MPSAASHNSKWKAIARETEEGVGTLLVAPPTPGSQCAHEPMQGYGTRRVWRNIFGSLLRLLETKFSGSLANVWPLGDAG
jgi:hypothetical protein